MGRMAESEEVASLVGFLVSPAAAYLTSANYAVDDGPIPVVYRAHARGAEFEVHKARLRRAVAQA
jgi:hypothetical protein